MCSHRNTKAQLLAHLRLSRQGENEVVVIELIERSVSRQALCEEGAVRELIGRTLTKVEVRTVELNIIHRLCGVPWTKLHSNRHRIILNNIEAVKRGRLETVVDQSNVITSSLGSETVVGRVRNKLVPGVKLMRTSVVLVPSASPKV